MMNTEQTPNHRPIGRAKLEVEKLNQMCIRDSLTAEPLPLEASHSEHPHMLGEAPGLTEVMGLAVLPAPLKAELASLEEAILKRKDIRSDPVLAKHADWIDRLKGQYVFTAATTREILLRETGKVFSHILEDASAFPHTCLLYTS